MSISYSWKEEEAGRCRGETQEPWNCDFLKYLALKLEHDKKVLQKAMKENNNFSKMVEEKLNQKMEANKEHKEDKNLKEVKEYEKKNNATKEGT